MARAKRTDRTDARRRYRAEQAALADAEPGAEGDAPTAKTSTSAKAVPLAPAARPSITAAMRGAYRPVHVMDDLKSLPQVVTNLGFLGAVGLTIVAGAWFVLAYNDAMAAIPVGTATPEQISWTAKFGIAASTCRVAMAPIGPSHACGAISTPDASHIAATFHSAVIPPTWLQSV